MGTSEMSGGIAAGASPAKALRRRNAAVGHTRRRAT